MLSDCFTPTQITNINNGNGAASTIPTTGYDGIRVVNRSGAWVFVLDDNGKAIDYVPPYFMDLAPFIASTQKVQFVVLNSDPVITSLNFPASSSVIKYELLNYLPNFQQVAIATSNAGQGPPVSISGGNINVSGGSLTVTGGSIAITGNTPVINEIGASLLGAAGFSRLNDITYTAPQAVLTNVGSIAITQFMDGVAVSVGSSGAQVRLQLKGHASGIIYFDQTIASKTIIVAPLNLVVDAQLDVNIQDINGSGTTAIWTGAISPALPASSYANFGGSLTSSITNSLATGLSTKQIIGGNLMLSASMVYTGAAFPQFLTAQVTCFLQSVAHSHQIWLGDAVFSFMFSAANIPQSQSVAVKIDPIAPIWAADSSSGFNVIDPTYNINMSAGFPVGNVSAIASVAGVLYFA